MRPSSRVAPRLIGCFVALLWFPACGTLSPVDGVDGGSADGMTPQPSDLRVSLTVSNPTPTVGEQVVFQCVLVEGPSDDVSYAYQGGGGRLTVDSRTGRASWIVNESDVGASLRLTCTAANQQETSEPSNAVTVIAS